MKSGFPNHSNPLSQLPTHPRTSGGSPSITSNTELEAVSKQALASNETDEFTSVSSPEQTHVMFELPNSSTLSCTTGPLSAALINHHQTYSTNLLGSPIHERTETELDSMFTAPTSLNKELIFPLNDIPQDVPPIFRNVLHVAIMYGM